MQIKVDNDEINLYIYVALESSYGLRRAKTVNLTSDNQQNNRKANMTMVENARAYREEVGSVSKVDQAH